MPTVAGLAASIKAVYPEKLVAVGGINARHVAGHSLFPKVGRGGRASADLVFLSEADKDRTGPLASSSGVGHATSRTFPALLSSRTARYVQLRRIDYSRPGRDAHSGMGHVAPRQVPGNRQVPRPRGPHPVRLDDGIPGLPLLPHLFGRRGFDYRQPEKATLEVAPAYPGRVRRPTIADVERHQRHEHSLPVPAGGGSPRCRIGWLDEALDGIKQTVLLAKSHMDAGRDSVSLYIATPFPAPGSFISQ